MPNNVCKTSLWGVGLVSGLSLPLRVSPSLPHPSLHACVHMCMWRWEVNLRLPCSALPTLFGLRPFLSQGPWPWLQWNRLETFIPGVKHWATDAYFQRSCGSALAGNLNRMDDCPKPIMNIGFSGVCRLGFNYARNTEAPPFHLG